jgi:hypothetical protein
MAEPKTNCIKCGTEILQVTAAYNNGLCGTCNRLQKQEERKPEVSAERRAYLERKRNISYEIDELLKSGDFINEIRTPFPEPWDDLDDLLFPEEIVLRGIAEFYGMCGNGFSTLVDNENFDVIRRSQRAARCLKPCLLNEALDRLGEVLDSYGFPDDPDACVDHWAELHKGGKSDDFSASVHSLDLEFFYGEHERSLWRNLSYIDAAREYALLHLEVLRQRGHSKRTHTSD